MSQKKFKRIRTLEDLPETGQDKMWTRGRSIEIGYLDYQQKRVFKSGGSRFEYIEEYVGWCDMPEIEFEDE